MATRKRPPKRAAKARPEKKRTITKPAAKKPTAKKPARKKPALKKPALKKPRLREEPDTTEVALAEVRADARAARDEVVRLNDENDRLRALLDQRG